MLSAFNKFKYLSVFTALSLLTFATHSKAFVINAVTAPDLTRPSDGVLYPFNITVSGTYTGADLIIAGVADFRNVTAEYWDYDSFIFDFLNPDDPIDLDGLLVIPLVGAAIGGAWGPVPIAFDVGCTTSSEIFGPSGTTGENPMDDGYFRFTTGAGLTWTDHGSWGYNTVTCAVEATGGNPVPLTAIPEPTTITLLGIGLAGIGWLKKKKNQPAQ